LRKSSNIDFLKNSLILAKMIHTDWSDRHADGRTER